MKKVLCALIVLNIACVLYSNTATYTLGSWGMLAPFKSYDLEMVSEKIDIDVYRGYINFDPDDKSLSFDYFYYEYKCNYTFKNTGTNESFWLGFPVEYGAFGGPGNYRKPIHPFSISECMISMDGSPVDFKKYIHGTNPELKEIDYDAVYGFRTRIKSGTEKSINVFYASTFVEPDGFNFDRRLNYILKSAQALKGKIKDADLSIRFHFPAMISVYQSPGEYETIKGDTDPYLNLVWNLSNVIPEDDLSISFNPSDTKTVNQKKPDYKSCMDRLDKEQSLAAFYELTGILAEKNSEDLIEIHRGKKKTWNDMNIDKSEVNKALKRYYEFMLHNSMVSKTFAGFLINDASKYPARSPDKTLIEATKRSVEKYAIQTYDREMELLADVDTSLKNNPFQKVLIEKALSTVSIPYGFFLEKNDIFLSANYFVKQLAVSFQKSNNTNAVHEPGKTLIDAYKKTLENMLASNDDYTKDILDFVTFDSVPIDFYDYYLDGIKFFTEALWNGKGKEEEKNKLTHLLGLLYQYEKKDLRRTYPELRPILIWEFHSLHFDKRSIIRRAFYSLANYCFSVKDFDNAILYYRNAMAYCVTSPLFDFMGFYSSYLNGTSLFWNDVDEEVFQTESTEEYDWNTRYKSTKAVMNTAKPFWKLLANPATPTETDIADLYIPESLLALDLEKWEIEAENNAPCYYIAYNTACAFSRLAQAKEALQWLTVALRMRGTLAKLIPGDTDLAFVRENEKVELDRIVKKYGIIGK